MNNKPYFTKYIPVEGEIKGGDYILREGGLAVTKASFGFEEAYNKDSGVKKVKLFLCSRGIKVGDKYFNKMGKEYTCESIFDGDGKNCPKETLVWHKNVEAARITFWDKLSECYKVIGEVSPEAIWVKPDMEFEWDEAQVFVNKFNQFTLPEWEDFHKNYTLEVVPYHIQFKCPCCGTFK